MYKMKSRGLGDDIEKFTKFTGEQIEGFINEHSLSNMNIFKEVIEKEAAATAK